MPQEWKYKRKTTYRHTDNPKAWHTAIWAHYLSAKEGFRGWTLKINQDDEPTTIVQERHNFDSGKPQSQDFFRIKERAQEEKA